MASNAEEYADSLSEDIRKDTDEGHPYGISEGYEDSPEGEPNTASDYLSDVLDIQYLVNSDRTYRSARILIAFGGPNAWIDTRTGQLELSWWSAPEYRELPAAFIDGLDEFLAEMWEMGA